MYIINDRVTRDLAYSVDSCIEKLLSDIYNQTGIITGDITIDLQHNLNQHINEIAHILREVILQNSTEPLYYDIDRQQFYTHTQMYEIWKNDPDLREEYEHCHQYINACLDKNGTLERI